MTIKDVCLLVWIITIPSCIIINCLKLDGTTIALLIILWLLLIQFMLLEFDIKLWKLK